MKRLGIFVTSLFLVFFAIIAIPFESVAQQTSKWDRIKQPHLKKKLEQLREQLELEGKQRQSVVGEAGPVRSGVDLNSTDELYTVFTHDQSWNRNPNPNPERNFELFEQGQPAGNINGDSSSDFIVTGLARDENTSELHDQTWKTAVYFGGNTSGDPDQIIRRKLIPVGDLNGDGFDDAVAEETYLPYEISPSAPYIYKGTSSGYQKTNNLLDNFYSGWTHLGFNDYNRDGRDDILSYNEFSDDLYIFWGEANLNDISSPTIYNSVLTSTSKRIVVEDVDNDTTKEAVELSGYAGISGQLKVFEIDSIAKEFPFDGIIQEQSFSYSFFSGSADENDLHLIDINGNGYSEIYISEGRKLPKYVVEYDSTTGQYNTTATEFFDGSLVPAGDLNNDGKHDFIQGDSTDSYKPHISYGDSLHISLSLDVELNSNSGGEWIWEMFYNPYSSFGDLDGDGVDDTILEHNEETSGSRTLGRRILTGIASDSEFHDSIFHQYSFDNFFSTVFETEEVGDINEDGVDDFAVAYFDQRKVEIFHGDISITQTPGMTIDLGYAPWNMTSGDFNGDGKTDLVVLGYDYRDEQNILNIYYGGSSMDGTADYSVLASDFQTADYNSLFGVQNIGDVNDDGIVDLLAGSSFAHDSTSDGLQFLNEAYIFYGGSSIAPSPDETIPMGGSSNRYIWAGETAAPLGDMNGDGVDDFAVSAGSVMNEDETFGHVYIFYGGSGKTFSEPEMTIRPEKSAYGFGWGIGAGDFTGDGSTDIAITSDSFFGGETEDPSAVHLYHGGTDFDNTADRFLVLPEFIISDFIDDEGFVNFNFGTLEVLPDFTNDGKDELILTSSYGNSHAALYTFNNNKDSPTSVLKAPNRSTGLGGPYNIANGDFNDDGQSDVVLTQIIDNNDAHFSSRFYRYGLPEPLKITAIEDVPDDQGGWVRVNVGGFLMDAMSEDIYGFDSWAVRRLTEDSSWTSLATVKPYKEGSKSVDVHLPKTQPTGIDSVDYSYQLKVVAYDYTADNETRVISESSVLTARAFDNIAPAQVQGASVSEQNGSPVISWSAVDDVHKIQYLVYKADAVSDGLVGSTTGTSFTLPENDEGIQQYIVRALDVNNNLGAPSDAVRAVYPQTVDYDMTEGWNLIGLPVEADAEAIQSILSEVNLIYEYDGSYKLVEDLQAGKGYWAKFSAADLFELTGLPTDEITLSLEEGWNLISGVGDELPLSAVEDPDEIIIPETLTSFGQMYVTEDSLKPGTGYWIRASAAGQVTLKHPAFLEVQEQPKANPDKKTKGIDEIFNSVAITDDLGHSKQLYFGADLPDRFDKLSYTLPPLPPGEVFDARFKQNGRLTESDRMQISLKKLEGSSLSMKINVQSLAEYGAFTVKEFGEGQLLSEYTIEPGNPVQLAHSETDAVYLAPVGSSLAGSETPEKFDLEQNYPNPFNPTTRIEYSVAETTPVTLEVFNILGKRVATLVDKEQQPGFYDVTFDGSGLASGLYLYRLKTGSYISIKKFILAK